MINFTEVPDPLSCFEIQKQGGEKAAPKHLALSVTYFASGQVQYSDFLSCFLLLL